MISLVTPFRPLGEPRDYETSLTLFRPVRSFWRPKVGYGSYTVRRCPWGRVSVTGVEVTIRR